MPTSELNEPNTTRRAGDAALHRIPAVRAVGGPGEIREAAGVLERSRPRDGNVEALRNLALAVPWTAALLVRLVQDRRVALRHRSAIVAAAGYLLFPFDPIPDFLPVIGALDDVLVALIVVRWVIRSVDPAVLDEHWHGAPDVIEAMRAISGADGG